MMALLSRMIMNLFVLSIPILSRVVRPQLTSVVVPLYDLGAVAMRLLTKLMNGEEVEEEQVILPYQI